MGTGMGMPPTEVYNVPWCLGRPDVPSVTARRILYWFPSSVQEVHRSSLRTSRLLSLYATQCVSMEIADADSPLGQKLVGDAKLPVAVLATPDGTSVAKVENNDGYLRIGPVEKVVDAEFKHRESSLEQQLKQAKERAKSGDSAGAIPLYRAVLEQKCLFPNKAKDAAKELKKLGANDVGDILSAPDFDSPIFDAARGAKIERTMLQGPAAENAAQYTRAERLYARAHT